MKFLVESRFKIAPTPEILALIPNESAHGKALEALGTRERLYLAADMSRSWQVFNAESLRALEAILATFPLAGYVASVITELAPDDAPSP